MAGGLDMKLSYYARCLFRCINQADTVCVNVERDLLGVRLSFTEGVEKKHTAAVVLLKLHLAGSFGDVPFTFHDVTVRGLVVFLKAWMTQEMRSVLPDLQHLRVSCEDREILLGVNIERAS